MSDKPEISDEWTTIGVERDEALRVLGESQQFVARLIEERTSLRIEVGRLRQDVELWKGNYETLKSSIAVHQQDYDESQAEVERLRADVLELNGMVAMLNEQLIEWKRRAETAEARLARPME